MFNGEKAKVLTRPRMEPVSSLGLIPNVRRKSGNLHTTSNIAILIVLTLPVSNK